MPRIVETTVYKFDELSDKAKEKARDWYRELGFDYEWWDDTYAEAKEIGKAMGITIEDIRFSGFWSQGDGASFTGTYEYAGNAELAVKQYAPTDEKLHAIAAEFDRLQGLYNGNLHADIRRSNSMNYVHSNMMDCDAYDIDAEGDDSQLGAHEEKPLLNNFKSYANWIYTQLESTHEALTSDESVDESITANEYEFTAEGKPA